MWFGAVKSLGMLKDKSSSWSSSGMRFSENPTLRLRSNSSTHAMLCGHWTNSSTTVTMMTKTPAPAKAEITHRGSSGMSAWLLGGGVKFWVGSDGEWRADVVRDGGGADIAAMFAADGIGR